MTAGYDAFFFDLDSTLTPSRAPMRAEHRPVFERLCREREVVVVTGGAQGQIQMQIPLSAAGAYAMLSQQGNYAIAKDGTLLWHESISSEQERAVRAFCDALTRDLALPVTDPDDLFENRGSQLAYSTLGFHAPNELKYAYDPDQSKRRALLAAHADSLVQLRAAGIEAMPAGSTTIDFILAGKNKGHNIRRFLAREGWDVQRCVYVGDALFPGGNDESVIGVIPTHAVVGPDETFAFVSAMLG